MLSSRLAQRENRDLLKSACRWRSRCLDQSCYRMVRSRIYGKCFGQRSPAVAAAVAHRLAVVAADAEAGEVVEEEAVVVAVAAAISGFLSFRQAASLSGMLTSWRPLSTAVIRQTNL